ncbi:endonuclease domain-containing protein [Sphingomonas mali]|uniref:endonuclease domain-containing protein n=1 Tax=Sphingomonas mali TaxID=40682 RepID=UPI000830975E|nr:DUF559 domain-containing protein [Sphingomonas mali]
MRLYANKPIGTVPRARQLRRDAASPERRLLRALREALPELKWRHQAPIGPFFADIMCFSESLVIEVDGDTHADTAENDASRTRVIESEGFHVLRFSNGDVMGNIDGVVAHVAMTLGNRKEGIAA